MSIYPPSTKRIMSLPIVLLRSVLKLSNRTKEVYIFCLFALLLANSSSGQIYPDIEWGKHKNLAELGLDKASFDDFEDFLLDSTQLTGLLLVHQGQVIFEFGDVKENSYIASCRKSILALLYGKYVENGKIDLGKSLKDLNIEDHTPFLQIEQRASIQDIISARSAVFLPGSNGGDFRSLAPQRGSFEPGSYWLYSNWDFNLAGFIFEEESGQNIYDEIESQLVIPLKMQDWDPSLQEKSGNLEVSKFPAYHMWLSTRDMARIGLLMLRKGMWNGRQVVSEDWLDEVIFPRTSYKEAQKNAPILKEDGLDLGYGYMWWLVQNTNDFRMKNAYSAQGALGQNITVYPEIDLVLAFKTATGRGKRNSIQTQIEVMKKAAQIFKPKADNK